MTTARSDLPPASDPNASADDLDDSVADIMPKIDGAAGDDTGEMMVVDAGASDAVPLLAPFSNDVGHARRLSFWTVSDAHFAK